VVLGLYGRGASGARSGRYRGARSAAGRVGVGARGNAARFLDSGISGPGIYKHFGSKEEILAVLLERSALKLLIGLGRPQENPSEDLETVVKGHVEFVLAHPKLASIWVREVRSLGGPYAQRMTRMADAYTDRVLTAMRRRFRHRTDEELLSAIWMMIYQLSALDMWPPEARKADDLEGLMVDITLNGLSALDKPSTVTRASSA
jgi:AcrR family transcriptional regulator